MKGEKKGKVASVFRICKVKEEADQVNFLAFVSPKRDASREWPQRGKEKEEE
jgi:DNA-binding helix-hairpin-helix protein with protein kinase domain